MTLEPPVAGHQYTPGGPTTEGYPEWTSLVLASYLELRPEFESDQPAIDALADELKAAYATRLNLTCSTS